MAWALLLAGLVATTASAEEPMTGTSVRAQVRAAIMKMQPTLLRQATTPAPAPEPESKKVTVTGAFDVPSLYVFRGIRQEFDPQLTLQPYVNVAVAASDSLTLNVGSWNSLHTGSTKDAAGAFYESDFYASAALAPGGKVNPTILYTAYTSPADAFNTVHELAFIAAIDDSGSAMPFAPVVTVAFELGEHSADAGGRKGTYFELGLTPAIPVGDDSPVTVTVPIKLGLSLHNYYEHPTTSKDEKFGYLSVGGAVTYKFAPNLDLHGSLIVYTFGDSLEHFNNGEATQVVGTVGLGFSF